MYEEPKRKIKPAMMDRLRLHQQWLRSGGSLGEQLRILRRKDVGALPFWCTDASAVDFSYSVIEKVRYFAECDLRFANFTGANLKNVVFGGCDLEGATFDHARFTNVRFYGCSGNASFKDITVAPSKDRAAFQRTARELRSRAHERSSGGFFAPSP